MKKEISAKGYEDFLFYIKKYDVNNIEEMSKAYNLYDRIAHKALMANRAGAYYTFSELAKHCGFHIVSNVTIQEAVADNIKSRHKVEKHSRKVGR